MCAFHKYHISAETRRGLQNMPDRAPGSLKRLQWLKKLFSLVFREIAIPNEHLYDWLSSTVFRCLLLQSCECLLQQPLPGCDAHRDVRGDPDVEVALKDCNPSFVLESVHDHLWINLVTEEMKGSAAFRQCMVGGKLTFISVEPPCCEVVVGDGD